MKKNFGLLLLLLLGCSSKQRLFDNQSLSGLELIPSIENDSISLIFKNNSNKSMLIRKPCSINTFVHVFYKEEILRKKVLIRISPNCSNERYSIKANSFEVFMYKYKVSKLYDLKSNQSYDLFFEYFPNTKALKENRSLKSNIISFKL